VHCAQSSDDNGPIVKESRKSWEIIASVPAFYFDTYWVDRAAAYAYSE
jgi:hypothetical protein